MSKAAQLRKKGSEFEQKKQYDRALTVYVQAIEAAAEIPEDVDIPLYNRVGDLHLRLGDLDQAVAYYEIAVDLYTEGGFFNNAIALCNKVLRHAPSRSSVYYKLGKISAQKGFNSDAKQNFLEYASRMQKAGEIDEAFRALKEFADLCSGQDDVRLMLADQLARAGRKDEAMEQLQIVYDTMVAEDRMTEAAATLERMRALDPAVMPKPSHAQRPEKRDGLVFIDVSDEPPPQSSKIVAEVIHPDMVEPVEGLEMTSLASDPTEEDEPPPPVELEESDLLLSDSEDEQGPPSPSISILDNSLELSMPESIVDEPTSLVLELPDTEPEQADPLAQMPPSSHDVGRDIPHYVLQDSDSDFVDLQAWLLETEPPKNPRMTAADEPQLPGMVQTDFTEMLETFKRGVAANVDESDSDSQYDLGVAYMEMGLLDEAVVQFQKALRGNAVPERRVRAYESLGQCFIEQGQYDVAVTSLRAALHEQALGDDKLVGVLYLMGCATESLGLWSDAAAYYQRVFAVDVNFRDAGERLRRAKLREQRAGAS
jgi:tetratricopeptide (TPR) repeat protein